MLKPVRRIPRRDCEGGHSVTHSLCGCGKAMHETQHCTWQLESLSKDREKWQLDTLRARKGISQAWVQRSLITINLEAETGRLPVQVLSGILFQNRNKCRTGGIAQWQSARLAWGSGFIPQYSKQTSKMETCNFSGNTGLNGASSLIVLSTSVS